MGKMKKVFQLKQEMVERNSFLEDMPDEFFIGVYLTNKEKEELQEQIEYYESNVPLPQDNYNYDPDGEGAPGVN